MEITVPYGKTEQQASIHGGIDVQIVERQASLPEKTVEEMVEAALDAPYCSGRLENLAFGKNSIAIIVNDHTRPGPTEAMLRGILGRICGASEKKPEIRIVVATGNHRAPTKQELRSIVGGEIAANFEILAHDCTDSDNLAYAGRTQAGGLDVYVNKAVAEAEMVICTGLIAPHHCAGYSGGCKSIVPGVSGLETLKKHHSFPIYPYEPAMGWFEGNPFHETALEAAKLVGVDFILNAVQDSHKQIVGFVAGDLEKAHRAGAEMCRQCSEVRVRKAANVIITSPRGFPRDIDLYQSQKALSVAERLAMPGCIFILVAEAAEGFGNGEFRHWMEEGADADSIIERFAREGFTIGSNKAFLYARALKQGEVIVVTGKAAESGLRKAKLGWAQDLQAAIDYAIEKKKPDTITVIPYANNFIADVME